MRFIVSTCAALVIVAGTVKSIAAEPHRLIVLDLLSKERGLKSKLLLIEVESGKVVAEVELGDSPQLGLSPKGDVLAVITRNVVDGVGQPQNRLEVFQTSDLKRLMSGLLPGDVQPTVFQETPESPTLAVSPDGKEIVVPRMVSSFTDEKPLRWPLNNGVLSFVTRELDQKGVYKQSRKDINIPRCLVPTFLRLSDWPRIHIWNASLGVVEVVDIEAGTILSRLALDYSDDPALKTLDPSALEKPNIGELSIRLGANGVVQSGGGRFAYYLPQPLRNPKSEPGHFKKIDLAADPPKVVKESAERQGGLRAHFSAVADQGGEFFVLFKNGGGPTRRVKMISTGELKVLNEIESTLPEVQAVTMSADGQYVYFLNRDQAKISVVDAKTGKESKLLSAVGKYPRMALPLP